MGGKGQRRREKNFRAAHGSGGDRLPPPPKLSELDALPSKLRRIMELKNPTSTIPGHTQSSGNAKNARGKGGTAAKGVKKENPKDVHAATDHEFKMGDNMKKSSSKHKGGKDAGAETNSSDVKKGKRKRKAVDDLRFENLDPVDAHSRKKERKKEYFEAKKKKQKKAKTDEILDFPGHEEIKFGEVVKAPPKLSFLKKGLKTPLDASHERLRLQAVEAYRSRRGWVSRPGIHLPSLVENPSS